MQKFMCYCTVFALFYCEFEGNFRVQTPGDLYLKGPPIYRRVFALRVWVGIYLEGLIHVGAYFRNFKEIRNQYNSN